MKKLFAIAIISTLVWSCSKKMSPSTTNAASPGNNGSVVNDGKNGSSNAAPAPAAPAASPAEAAAATGSRASSGTKDALAQGQSTYNAKCGRCHGLKVTTDYTAERWVSIMQVMAPKARLDETEKANVLAYVQANSKK